MVEHPGYLVRPAVHGDYAAIRDLTVSAYLDDGLAGEDYRASLADVEGRARDTELLVAVESTRVLGSVAFCAFGSAYAEITRDPTEAAFRMLAVSPAARGRGVGRALVLACLDRARDVGAARVVISTGSQMLAAQRLYRGLGFRPVPDRDWSPHDDVQLHCYVLELGAG